MLFGSGDGDDFKLAINADGTGTMLYAGEGGDITWTQKDANTITIGTTSGEGIDAVYEDGALKIAMNDDTFSGVLIFTRDGSYPGAKEISLAGAKDITSEDALIGEWSLSGMNMGGMTVYGAKEDLAALAGDDSMAMSLVKGGTGKAFGDDITWEITANGAVITVEGDQVPVKAFGNDLLLDAHEAAGDLDLGATDFLLVFSK